jgi:hypothetical protein
MRSQSKDAPTLPASTLLLFLETIITDFSSKGSVVESVVAEETIAISVTSSS